MIAQPKLLSVLELPLDHHLVMQLAVHILSRTLSHFHSSIQTLTAVYIYMQWRLPALSVLQNSIGRKSSRTSMSLAYMHAL